MMGDELEGLSRIKDVDQETHDSIVHLNHKLLDIQAEIEDKIKELGNKPENESRINRICALSDEIKKALASIQELVSLVGAQNISQESLELIKQANLTLFRDMIHESVEQIDKIKDNL